MTVNRWFTLAAVTAVLAWLVRRELVGAEGDAVAPFGWDEWRCVP